MNDYVMPAKIATVRSLPIEIPRDQLEKFCLEHQVAKLSLFGSILRDDFSAESDIDFLVEFQKGYIPTFLILAQMEDELSPLLQGRKIDLRTPAEISHHFRDRIMAEARVEYERN
jgi:hypothetical protein